MKKLPLVLSIIIMFVLLGLVYLYYNPELSVSQKLLTSVGRNVEDKIPELLTNQTNTGLSKIDQGITTGLENKEIDKNISNIDLYFKNYNEPIDIMFKNVLIQNKLDFIKIPDHIKSKMNGPYGAIDIDGGYRFTLDDKDEVCNILKTFNRTDLSCYDEENGASIYIEFKTMDENHMKLLILHYVGMLQTELVSKIYKIGDIMPK